MEHKTSNPKWDTTTIKSRDAVVKADSAIEMKAGHLLFEQEDGTYKAYPVDEEIEKDSKLFEIEITGGRAVSGDKITVNGVVVTPTVDAEAASTASALKTALEADEDFAKDFEVDIDSATLCISQKVPGVGEVTVENAEGATQKATLETHTITNPCTGHVAVLGSDTDITEDDLEDGITARVIFIGEVYVQAVLDAGMQCSKKFILGLSADRSAIHFIDYDNMEAYV